MTSNTCLQPIVNTGVVCISNTIPTSHYFHLFLSLIALEWMGRLAQ